MCTPSAEAMNLGITWSYVSAVSNTPVFAYLLVLVLDVFIYSGIAFILSKPSRRRDHESEVSQLLEFLIGYFESEYRPLLIY